MFQSFQDVQTAYDGLLSRVNALDGQNLPNADLAAVAQLRAALAGFKVTIEQLTLTIDSQLDSLQTSVNNLTLALHQLQGIS